MESVKDILEIAGYDTAEIEQELIFELEGLTTWQSLLVVWLDMLANQFAKSDLYRR